MVDWLPPLPTFPDPQSEVSSARALHARYILYRYLEKSKEVAKPKFAESRVVSGLPFKVGIIGGGAAGLYAAYILQYIMSQRPNAGITYEVLEADPNRVGGRLYTHRFVGGNANDYYDVGAMRFPQGIPYMNRFFDLLRMLHIDTINYVMTLPQNLNFFNGVLLTNAQVHGPDPFHTGVQGLFGSVTTMVDQQIGRFRDKLVKNWADGWNYLMEYDDHSARSYMVLDRSKPRYSPEVVDYLETFQTGTNIYDQALTETVIHSLDFDYPNKDPQWKCIQGGTQQIAEKMVKALLPRSVQLGQRVTAIQPVESTIRVTIDNTEVRTYQHVISTVPFSCLRAIDTSGCNLPWEVRSAMRMLHYDASTKVAIQFQSRWWEVGENGQLGGVSKTDRPTRIVVYPSYGIGEEDGATMIVSYTWSQDAIRVGAFLGGESDAEEHLIDLILKDLSDMHRVPFETLKELMIDYHAYEWHNHEFSAGAYALFGPSQFSSLYPHVTRSHCVNKLHLAGEATSVHHGWVVGALDSAYRTVYEILRQEKRDDLIEVMEAKFEKLDEISNYMMDARLERGL